MAEKSFAAQTRGPGASTSLYIENTDRSGGPRQLFKFDNAVIAGDWSSDGDILLVQAYDYAGRNNGWDVLALPLQGKKKPSVLLGSNSNERDPQFSPDSKWLSYISDESGQDQLYVTTSNGQGSKLQISVNGADWGKWVDGGRKIYFVTKDNRVLGVNVSHIGSSLAFSKPYIVFSPPVNWGTLTIYDISISGKRFLIGIRPRSATPSSITIMSNWKKVITQAKG